MSGSAGDVTVSVVLPAYNEEDTIEDTVEVTLSRLASFLPAGSFEVIVAEDGCEDRTPELAERLAARDDRVRHIHSEERLGRGGALERAFGAASGDVLVYFDTDLATDLTHLETLVDSIRSEGYDVATGSRWIPGQEADRPLKRGALSRGFNRLVRAVLRSELRDHQCGFKAVSREAFDDLVDDVQDQHWFWDTELLVRAQRRGFRVKEFPVDWEPKGDTKVDIVRDVLGMGTQIVRLCWQLSVRPRVTRRVSVVAGSVLILAGLALMTVYLDLSAVVAEMRRADTRFLAGALLVYVLSWPIRGYRYRDILRILGYPESVGFLTGAIFVSQTGNLVFPARAGDGVRAYIVKVRRGIPYPTGFASLATERVFDLLTLTGLAGVVLIGYVATGRFGSVVAAVTGGHEAGRTAVMVAAGVGVVAVAAAVGIALSARFETSLVRGVVTSISDDSYADYVATALERFVGDVQRVGGNPAAFSRVAASSVLIWTLDVLVATVVLAAFGVNLDVVTLVFVCFFAVSVGNLAKVLPLSPGGIGLYEGAFTVLVIGLTPIGWATALGAAILDHALKNVVTLTGGLGAMLALNVSITTAVDESTDVTDSEPSHE